MPVAAELLISRSLINVNWTAPTNGETASCTKPSATAELTSSRFSSRIKPIHTQDRFGKTPLLLAVPIRDQKMVALLPKSGADANLKAGNLSNPFLQALQLGDTQIAQVLVDHGAQVNALNQDGLKPVYVAAEVGDVAMLGFLLDRGADIDAPPESGIWTPLMAAANWSQMVTLHELLNHGADHGIESPLNGLTALHFPATQGPPEAVGLFLAYGAFQKRSRHGFPVDMAIQCRQYESADLLYEYGMTEPPPGAPFTERLWRAYCEPTLCPPITEVPPKDTGSPTRYYPVKSAASPASTVSSSPYPPMDTAFSSSLRRRIPPHTPAATHHITDQYNHRTKSFTPSKASASSHLLMMPATGPSPQSRKGPYVSYLAPSTAQPYEYQHRTPSTSAIFPGLELQAAGVERAPDSLICQGQQRRVSQHRRSRRRNEARDNASTQGHRDTDNDP
ncbi:uncharacterized protein Z519_08059 [Cladophialophora bantiana CBS 173.52]|uniref:Ankyrin n=1 Tax=Cladophialophora bantiana (strain ATCC 10958 / CBS 173.52 / CDC B-1940 / NIH 8579) TaxID=1442370 RepID=A0A0D2I2P4_CLAB1|nr:uncharacterized protein Z519_08059 [Cladophialophora bantiana CBS 173.52]KIW91164.1 hypothetical protein Z519_08059 [Cladophialophora bantiana CBS 173.52]